MVPWITTLLLLAIHTLYINARISDLNTNMHKRIDDTNRRMEALEASIHRLEDVVVGKLTEVESRLTKIESRLEMH